MGAEQLQKNGWYGRYLWSTDVVLLHCLDSAWQWDKLRGDGVSTKWEQLQGRYSVPQTPYFFLSARKLAAFAMSGPRPMCHNKSYRTTHSATVNFASEQIRPSIPLTDDEKLQSTIHFLFSRLTHMTTYGTKQCSGSHNKLHGAYEEANIKMTSIGPS
jgi:hypothetical protein